MLRLFLSSSCLALIVAAVIAIDGEDYRDYVAGGAISASYIVGRLSSPKQQSNG